MGNVWEGCVFVDCDRQNRKNLAQKHSFLQFWRSPPRSIFQKTTETTFICHTKRAAKSLDIRNPALGWWVFENRGGKAGATKDRLQSERLWASDSRAEQRKEQAKADKAPERSMIASVAKGFATKSKAHAARSMSTIRYAEYGHPLNVLKTEADDKDAELGRGQVALKFLAAPINVSDLSQIQGHYAIRPKFPAVAGNEGVAVVTAVGADVKNVKVNDRVIPTQAGFGTWRNKAVAASADVTKISDKIKIEDAATLSVNPATAYRMLADFAELKSGDVVIQNGANSAVGQAVIQLAALRGIKTINVVRDDGDYDLTNEHLKSLGATVVVTSDYLGSAKFKELISDLPAPKLALNCVGGKSSLEIGKVLAKKGVHVTYGGMSKEAVSVGTGSLLFHDITLKGFWLSEWVKESSVDERVAMLNELAALMEAGKLRTWIETYKFADFDDALVAAVNRTTKRKIVLLME